MSARVLRPFLLLPRNGEPVKGSEDAADVVKDFRPAVVAAPEIPAVVFVEPVVEVVVEDDTPKAPANPESPATGSASASPDDAGKNAKQGTETPTDQTSKSESSESPANAEREKLLHPTSLRTTGKNAQPAGA